VTAYDVITKLCKLQSQANLLKNMAVTGTATRIITIGIGMDVGAKELMRLATAPRYSIVFPNPGDLTSPPSIEQETVNMIFGKQLNNNL